MAMLAKLDILKNPITEKKNSQNYLEMHTKEVILSPVFLATIRIKIPVFYYPQMVLHTFLLKVFTVQINIERAQLKINVF